MAIFRPVVNYYINFYLLQKKSSVQYFAARRIKSEGINLISLPESQWAREKAEPELERELVSGSVRLWVSGSVP